MKLNPSTLLITPDVLVRPPDMIFGMILNCNDKITTCPGQWPNTAITGSRTPTSGPNRPGGAKRREYPGNPPRKCPFLGPPVDFG